jgi:M6 family metalloprotease-like protein
MDGFTGRRALRGAVALLAGVAALVLASSALATPADPNVVKTLRQPDGTTIQVHLWGDEFIHGYETLGGYTLAYDAKDKTWKYAERDARGRLKPSKAVAKQDAPAAERHLRPTRAAFNDARAAQGAPALGAATLAAAPAWAGSDTDLLFLVVEFTDTGCTFTPTQMQTNMFGGGASGPGDLDDYFDEISYGKLTVVGNVVGNQSGSDCIALANNRAYYNTGAADRDDELVREAVNAANAYVNFADYDNDNDGTVDAMGIIYAGGGPHDGCSADAPPNGSGGDNLWPHSGAVNTGGALTADGKTITPFIINSEITYALATPSTCDQIQTIGLFAHELGHSMGLPDLYDTDIGSGGVGTWSAMASQYLGTANNADTPPHYDAWSKAFEGWVSPIVHEPADRFLQSLPRVEDNGAGVHQFRQNPDGFEIGGLGEYFLIENRQKTGFDAQLAGCGILVWHIAEDQSGNQNGGHTAASHRLVDIDEADGLAELDGNGAPDAGDPFPGSTNNTLFSDSTNPNAVLYNGSNSGLRMRVLTTSCASTMNAAFGPNQIPVADAGGPYTTNEGTDVGLTAAGSSDPDSDALTYAWDLDNDGQFDDSTDQTPTFSVVGDNGSFTVRVRVTDAWGDTDDDSATVTVNNVAPRVTSLSNTGPVTENASVTINGVIADAGWLDTLSASVDWGDGSGALPAPLSGTSENSRPDATLTFSGSHVYGDNGTFTVTVCGMDDDLATTTPCATTVVTVTNVLPTALLDQAGSILVNGVPTFITHAGQTIAFTGSSFDPGSDDRTTSWDWDDGAPAPDVTATSFDNGSSADPFPSPSINPRTVTHPAPHAFGDACFYTVTFAAADDDGGAVSSTVKVIVTGNAAAQRDAGYWQTQYRPRPTAFSDPVRLCYLAIVDFMSTVFGEQRDAKTVAHAFDVLYVNLNKGTEQQKLDRQILTAWLNFANGAFDYGELLDTNGDKVADTQFSAIMAAAEAARIGGNTAQMAAQRRILERING